MKPKLSICCLAYNHEPFIRACLDGFLMQKTNFPFEVLIHDDASTDGTARIIGEYAENYPGIIQPIYQIQNQYSQGIYADKFNYERVRGEYVAMCEGDDYWTDPDKLQIQVDYLDAHPECAICFHQTRQVFEDGSQPDLILPHIEDRSGKSILDFDDLVKKNFMQTNTCVYRWLFHGQKQESYMPPHMEPTDWYLNLLHAKTGNIAFIERVMSVYRKHPGGLWFASTQGYDAFLEKLGRLFLRFRECVSENLLDSSNDYLEQEILPLLLEIFYWTAKYKSFADLWRFCKEEAPYWKKFSFKKRCKLWIQYFSGGMDS
jgi:glycosyltransferase involved in cell wall biosynthesis